MDPELPLSYEHTMWTAERTLITWIRTALLMISFGFAIDTFFAEWVMHGSGTGAPLVRDSLVIGLGLVLIGNTTLLMATVQHTRCLRNIRSETGRPIPRWSLALMTAVLLQVLGLAALIFIVSRVVP